MRLQLSDIPDAVAEVDQLPRVDWKVMDRWLEANFLRTDRRAEARLELVLQWLELLAERLGDDYWINSSPRCVLLTNQPKREGDDLVRFAERALDQIACLLDMSPDARAAPKHVLVRLHSFELYYTYISHFYPEGEYGGSGGICIREGMPHIALPPSPSCEQSVIVHELVHAVLSELNVPQWIEEGVALILEQGLTGRPEILLNHETARDLRAYWNSHGLNDFWNGKSFHSPDKGQEFSYQLAEILVRLILADHRHAFLKFLRQANHEDGGESAARGHLGKSLNDVAATFLGYDGY
jgi:hypothetical protein